MSNVELIEKIEALAGDIGFECIGHTDASELRVREEVRNMCAADLCHSYDHNWACPPGCGSIEEYGEMIAARESVVIFQTVAELEDEFDFETMMESAETHKDRVQEFNEAVREIIPDCLVLAAGACTICPECSYPDAPCRFPDKRLTSMEAAGLVVSDTCTSAGIPYNHGSDHLAYVSCVIF